MAKVTLNRITQSRGSKDLLNNNSTLLEAAVENTLSLDGTTPNGLNTDLDLNNNNLLNGGTLYADDINIAGQPLTQSVQDAADSAAAALVSENNAAVSETNADADAIQTAADVLTVQDQKIIWLGAYAGGTTYAVNDAVSSGGSSYICIAPTTGNTPPNVSYWGVLAQQGSAGGGTGDMLAANNLSDVANPTTARSNLVISATNTPYTPAGAIGAMDVQAAITELDTEKEPADVTILKDADIGTTVQGYDADTPTVVVSQVDAEAGTATDNRTWTAVRVKQAIIALSGSVGVGQTWQDVAGSRSANTDYTNNTGKPIQVIISSASEPRTNMLVDSVIIGVIDATTNTRGQITFIVPDGSVYRVNGAITIASWAELR